jgi:ferredoxin-NADP reductase
MEETAYRGLLYLTGGFGFFTTMLFGFRSFGFARSALSGTVATGDATAWIHKEALKIADIIEETYNVKTFKFVRSNGKLFPPSLPGQFLSFQIGDDAKCLRSYSISASAKNCATLQVSIKRLDNGKGSTWFHSRNIGDVVMAFPPNGLFTDDGYDTNVVRNYVAGGIGITPMLSMILTNLDAAVPCKMNLFYGMRSTKDLAFHDLLAYLAKRHPQLNYVPVVSEKSDDWSGLSGMITAQMLIKSNSSPKEAMYFFCAPTPMTDALTDGLMAAGVPDINLHAEKFVSPTTLDPEKIPTRQALIKFRGQTFKYEGKQTILEFMETQNQSISFACRVGVCGTCKCKVTGKIHALTDSGLNIADKKAGMVLTCVAFPEGDVELS